jgi:hypothetical protein
MPNGDVLRFGTVFEPEIPDIDVPRFGPAEVRPFCSSSIALLSTLLIMSYPCDPMKNFTQLVFGR